MFEYLYKGQDPFYRKFVGEAMIHESAKLRVAGGVDGSQTI